MANADLVLILNGVKETNNQEIFNRNQAIADADDSIENIMTQKGAEKVYYQDQIDDLISKNSEIDRIIEIVQQE